jgi:hypothetical protein
MVMTNQFSQIRWGRVAWTALTVYGASFLLVFLIVTAYAAYLAFQARGAPDQTTIGVFASQYAPWIGTASLVLFTFLGTLWMARFVKTAYELHGLVLGIFISLVNIVFAGAGSLGLAEWIATGLVVGSGWLGGRVAAQRE